MFRRAVVCIVLGCSGMAALEAPAAAVTPFDGHWSVVARTTGGKCDPYLGFQLDVVDGRILSRQADISGLVTGAGAVRVTIRGKGSLIDGTGRLYDGAGSGRWSERSPSGGCRGDWKAKRRA
jgi:hypothetical protein